MANAEDVIMFIGALDFYGLHRMGFKVLYYYLKSQFIKSRYCKISMYLSSISLSFFSWVEFYLCNPNNENPNYVV